MKELQHCYNFCTGLFVFLLLQGCMKGSSEYDHGINAADKAFVGYGLHLHEIIASAAALVPGRTNSNDLEKFAANTHNEQLQIFRELDSVKNFIQLKTSAEANLSDIELKNKLITLKGRMFDSSYLRTTLTYYQKAIEVYNNQQAAGSNPSLKNFSSKKIEYLKTQVQEIEILYKRYQ